MKVAWIGLGQMGLPSAAKVAAAGHQVKGFDVKPPENVPPGIEMVASPRAAAEGAEVICIAVFSDAQVEEVLVGSDGFLKDCAPGTVIAIFTTGSIESPQRLAAVAPEGVSVLDTCFSRKGDDAVTGMMTLLAGGDAEGIARGKPVFDAFAHTIVHVGPVGSGRAIKLVNNILFAGHLQLAADALKLAEGLGLDPKRTAGALTRCSGASDVMARFEFDDVAPMLETAHRYMIKDVNAALGAASDKGVTIDALAGATAAYRG
jgi:3-hydroxyisobutyrate dehydrogenase-like beta-hydroxyacid dehydrogenase